MSWKEGIQISDLPDHQRLEFTCKRCTAFRFIDAGTLKKHPNLRVKYLDEFEKDAICHKWGCGGMSRLSLPPDSDTEGFQGGLA